MYRYLIAIIALAAVLLSVAAFAAIEVTTPETKPAVTINAARITQVHINFYTDGKTLSPTGFLAWEKGNQTGDTFTPDPAGKDNMALKAEDIAAILLAAQAVKPTEFLLGDAKSETPMDKLFPAIVAWLKSKGKM